VPFLAYIHSHDEGRSPGDERGLRPWEPNWRVWRWVAAAVLLTYAAVRSDGAVQALLVLLIFVFCCQAGAEMLPRGDGMREWRQ
jgi:hypothetical protein